MLRTQQTQLRNMATDIPIMSFADFQKSRVRVYDLRKHFNDTPDTFTDENNQGYVYLDGRYWISDPDGGPYWLLIERTELQSTDLDMLERNLYNYAVNAGDIIEDEPPTEIPLRTKKALEVALNLVTLAMLDECKDTSSPRYKELNEAHDTIDAILRQQTDSGFSTLCEDIDVKVFG